MAGHISATCKCGRRLSWFGEHANRPRCPRCGHRPSDATLRKYDAEDAAEEEKIMNRILERHDGAVDKEG